MPNRKKPEIDTRGEFLLKPTEAMWEAMRSADIGWPSWGEDPYVNELHEMAAELTGKEAAQLCPTTNVANLLGMMGYCRRGDVAIMEEHCHLWWVEERNIAALAAAVPRLIRGNKLGEMAVDDIEAALTDSAYGFHPRTSLVCLENTHNVAGGTALPLDYMTRVSQVAHDHGAAAIVALETMIPRLAEDHARARHLAELLGAMDGIRVDMETVQTNIVRVDIDCMTPEEFTERVLGRGVGVSVLDPGAVKFITHHGVDDGDIEAAAQVVGEVLEAA